MVVKHQFNLRDSNSAGAPNRICIKHIRTTVYQDHLNVIYCFSRFFGLLVSWRINNGIQNPEDYGSFCSHTKCIWKRPSFRISQAERPLFFDSLHWEHSWSRWETTWNEVSLPFRGSKRLTRFSKFWKILKVSREKMKNKYKH